MNPQSLSFSSDKHMLFSSAVSEEIFISQARCLRGLVTVVAGEQDQGVRKPACKVPRVSRTIPCFYFRGSESLVAGCYYWICDQLVHLQSPGKGFLMRMEAPGLQCETETAAAQQSR